MLKTVILALAFGICAGNPIPDPLAPQYSTTHLHSSTAAHHHHPMGSGLGYGVAGGIGGYGYPGVVKHTETHSSAAAGGYPASAALNPYSAYGYPGLAGLGYGTGGGVYGYPATKQYTQVSTTAIRPSMFGYY